MKHVAVLFVVIFVVVDGKSPKPRFGDRLGTNVVLDASNGETVKLGCKIKAKPKVITTWTKDGDIIPRSKGRVGVYKNQLLIRGVSTDDAGIYKCQARNRFGSVERVFTVSVDGVFTSDENSLEIIDEKDDLFDDDYDVRGKVKGLTEEILSLKEKMTSMVGKGMIHLHLNKLDDLDDDRNDVDDVLDISDEIDNRNEDKRKHINLNFRLNRRQISEKTPCSKQELHAHCEVFPNSNYKGSNNVTGHIHLMQKGDGPILINMKLKGFAVTTEFKDHGFHIHELGDLSNSCDSLGSHFNPYGMPHGAKVDNIRHIGDFGNIKRDDNGNINQQMIDDKVKLYGPYSLMGRSIVIHQNSDDLGIGSNPGSVLTGNAGARIACCIIGQADK